MSMVRIITGGVDTHADQHVVAAIDHNGGVVGTESFPATEAGFEAHLAGLSLTVRLRRLVSRAPDRGVSASPDSSTATT